jgi:uncharacterized membrane protein
LKLPTGAARFIVMSGPIVTTLVFIAAVASALVAGIFYTFSSFVMGALGHIPPEQGINAMRSINVVVLNPTFLGLFLGNTLLCAGLAFWALFFLGGPEAWLVLGASVLYVVGCFGVTLMFNVPLNDRLARAAPIDVGEVWQIYLRDWTMWNTVRTVAPIVATVLFMLALLQR